MAATHDATERSPLLRERDSTNSDNAPDAESNDSTNHNNANPQPSEHESPEILQSRKNIKRLLPVLSTGIFLAFLDQSIVAAINGDIGTELQALRTVSWIATAYFLTMTCSQPLYGRLSDVFGRKPCLVFAYAVFALGSLGCGLAPSMPGLIAGRAVQGIGGGGILIVVTVLLSDYIPLRERGTYQGYLNLIGAIGSTSGGPIGGFLVQGIGWRWAFHIQVFLCLIALLCIVFFLHLPQRKSEFTLKEQLKRIDFLGAILLILIVFGILFGLDRGTSISWRSPIALVPLCLTIPLTLAFLYTETRFASQPFTPAHIIFDRALFACYIQNFFGYAGLTALIFYLPLFFQVAQHMSPAQAGAGLIPGAVSVVIGTLLGGILLKRIGKFYYLALVSSSVGALATIPIAIAPSLHRGGNIVIYAASVVSFLPQGMTITASLIAIISNVAAKDQAVATACSFLFRALGAAVGVSLVGLVSQQVLAVRLRASLDPRTANHVLEEIGNGLDFIRDLEPGLQALVRECYARGVQGGFIMCVGLLAVGAVSCVWWRERRMGK
ncbi:MAG: hypothetical protein LQ352_008084 [Teloschistes flavicans]|nr:MAG: hypothetical protein LQ352_008084 [Teloschistes flavicans]